MSGPSSRLLEIADLLAPHGLVPRGLVVFEDTDGPDMADGRMARSVVLIGHAGSSLWPAFTQWRGLQPDNGGDDPLDNWSKAVISPVARQLGAQAYFPSDAPYQPFQRWAVAAEALTASPLGILIHPEFGLWHGYRGALGLAEAIAAPSTGRASSSPCASCADKPCIGHCPASAVSTGMFDVPACRTYLASPTGQGGCVSAGCAARAACPVGISYRYREEQVRFHMQALHIPAG